MLSTNRKRFVMIGAIVLIICALNLRGKELPGTSVWQYRAYGWPMHAMVFKANWMQPPTWQFAWFKPLPAMVNALPAIAVAGLVVVVCRREDARDG